MTTIRAFLFVEAIAFGLASLIHRGLLIEGYADSAASTAEGIIGIVLALGLIASWVLPRRTRLFGLLAQGFALAGTSIGLFLVIRGVGPNTVPDVVFHVGIYLVLIIGLVVTWRTRPQA
jgi:hypothetical protein